jgi:flagellar protein FliO/FliZ
MDTLRATGALIVVLCLVFLLSWFFKKMMVNKVGNNSVARIVGGVSLGSRERLVVVEVGTQWIVVGVTPGRITALANLDAFVHSVREQSRGDTIDAS